MSTGTKTLQDQLFERDLPLVRDALRSPVTIALLKGRANYVCHHHLERTSREGRLPSRDDARHLHEDRALRARDRRAATAASSATSRRTRRSGRSSRRRATTASAAKCAYYRECFVMKARKEALEADVVVVNHHLFFADVMLRDEGLAELLPACNTVILDEAHQLPDTATLFFGEQTTAGQLAELARDAEVAARTDARDVPGLPDAAADIAPAIRKLRLAAGELPGKLAQVALAARRLRRRALDELTAARRSRRDRARALRRAQRGPRERRAARRRGVAAARALARRRRSARRGGRALDPLARRHAERLPAARVAAVGREPVRAASSTRRARAWIFTSATLAVGRRLLALHARARPRRCRDRRWESPFDYAIAGAALRAARPARAQQRRAHRGGGRRRAAGARGARRPRVPAVHDAARADARASGSPTSCPRRRRLAAARAGRRLAHRAARALPRAGNARAARQRELLGRRRRRRRRAVGRRHRQAAVRAARRSAARGAARSSCATTAAIRSSTSSCRRRRSPQAGRRPADPHRDRPRRADDLRPAADRQALREAALASLPPMRRTREIEDVEAFFGSRRIPESLVTQMLPATASVRPCRRRARCPRRGRCPCSQNFHQGFAARARRRGSRCREGPPQDAQRVVASCARPSLS